MDFNPQATSSAEATFPSSQTHSVVGLSSPAAQADEMAHGWQTGHEQGSSSSMKEIQQSTRRALRETRAPDLTHSSTPHRRLRHSKSIEDLQGRAQTQVHSVRHTQLPRISSSVERSPSRNEGFVKRAKSGPLRRTLRRVFSRPSDEEIPGERARLLTPSRPPVEQVGDESVPKASAESHLEPWDRVSFHTVAPSVAESVPQPASPAIPERYLRTHSLTVNPRLETSADLPASTDRSRILRTNTNRERGPLKSSLPTSVLPSPTMMSSGKQSLHSQESPRLYRSQIRSYTSSASPRSTPSPALTRRTAPSSRRDSLELTRLPRHSHEKSSPTLQQSGPAQGIATAQGPSPLSPQVPRPPLSTIQDNSPDTIKAESHHDSLPRPSAPRTAMETMSIIARLEDVERRLTLLEQRQMSAMRAAGIEPVAIPRARGRSTRTAQRTPGRTDSPELRDLLPPAEAILIHDSSSIEEEEAIAPPTPPGERQFAGQPQPIIVEGTGDGDGPLQEVADRLLRHSILSKGHGVSIQRMRIELSDEQRARVALEGEVSAMRAAINELHQEIQGGVRASSRRSDRSNRSEHSQSRGVQPRNFENPFVSQWKHMQSRFSSDSSLALISTSRSDERLLYATADSSDDRPGA